MWLLTTGLQSLPTILKSKKQTNKQNGHEATYNAYNLEKIPLGGNMNTFCFRNINM